jgi:hypothetical protein
MKAVERHCPRAAAFPPSPPPRFNPICSETSSVLCSGPIAWARSSSAYAHALPDAIGAGLLHRCGSLHGRYTQALPIPAHDASVHAQVSDPAGSLQPLPERAARCGLPRVGTTSALGSCTLISGLNTGPAHSPVNASLASLPPPAHDSGPGWLAGPSPLGTCTPSTMPVFIGAPQRPARQPPAGRDDIRRSGKRLCCFWMPKWPRSSRSAARACWAGAQNWLYN